MSLPKKISTATVNNEKAKYEQRSKRMVGRWSGQRDKTVRRQNLPGNDEITNRCQVEKEPLSGLVYHEAARIISVMDECEVLVVGDGPSGLSAALAARRAGLDVG